MTKVKLFNGMDWSINKRFKTELDILLSDVKYDEMDVVIPITGHEGVGKSFFARGLAMYCATFLGTKFGVEDIEFDVYQYKMNSLEKPIYSVNLLDEARKVLGKGKFRDPVVEDFLDYLSECRKKQQVHLVLLPAYHDLKAYVVKWRCPMIIELRKNYVADTSRPSGVRMLRGEFRVYTVKKDINYFYEHPYRYPKKYTIRDRWSSKEVFTPEMKQAYEDKKDAFTIEKYGKKQEEKIAKRALIATRQKILPLLIKEFPNVDQVVLGRIFGCANTTISRDLKTIEAKNDI